MMLWIFWIMAEMERDLIRERTQLGKLKKSKKWYYVWWWRSMLWYEFYKDWIWTKIKINKDEKILVEKIFKLYTEDWKTLWGVKRILENDWEMWRDDKIKLSWWNTRKSVA